MILILPFFLFTKPRSVNNQNVEQSDINTQLSSHPLISPLLKIIGLITIISSLGTSDPILNLRYRFGTILGFSRIDLFLDTINNPDLLQRFINTIQIDYFQVSVGIVIIAISYLIESNNNQHNDSISKGSVGEDIVFEVLYKYRNKVKGLLYNDIIIGDFEKSTQIDHLLITNNAIYFVETKRYGGGVIGDDSKENWYQIKFNGSKKVKNSFLNPFIQNEHHIKRFKEYMGEIELPPLINIVCFVVNEAQTLDLSKIINRNKNYHLTDDKRLSALITKLDNEHKVEKTSTLALEQQSNHLIEVKNRITEIVATDKESRQNHSNRLKLKEVEQYEDENLE